MSALVSVSDLDLTIGTDRLLSGVGFEVAAGECVALVGETGAGKSLTCRVLIGLLAPTAVVTGQVQYAGRDLLCLRESEWREIRGREIGFVPQASLSALDPLMRVGAQMRETCRFLGVPRNQVDARCRDLLTRVHLDDVERVLRAYPHELSGGMRQRVMIALALVGNPRLLIADEATTALDVTVQRSILQLLAELRREKGLGMVFVSHDLGAVELIADSVAVMYDGAVVEQGTVTEVLTSPKHDYTRTLLAARPELAEPGTMLRTAASSLGGRVVGHA